MFVKQIVFLLVLSVSAVFAQQRQPLHGIVTVEGRPQGNVNIINLSDEVTNKTVVRSSPEGRFIINARAGDSLSFSSAELVKKTVSIKPEHLSGEMPVEMQIATFSLEEVVVAGGSKINALSLGIIQKEIKTRTNAERRLYTAGDFKPIHLLGLLAGSLQVDPILNAINGRTKRLKKEILIERKDADIDYLQEHYHDYMVSVLKVPEEEVLKFAYYIVEEPDIRKILAEKNIDMIKFRLSEIFSNYLVATRN